MPRGFQIGRLFGTDIFMSPTFLLLLAFYFLTSSREHLSTVAVFAVALILSLLVHEFGHVTAVRTLLRTDCWILLWAMGGLCIWTPTGDDSPRKRILIALAGPAFQVPLALVFVFLWLFVTVPDKTLASRFIFFMFWINVVWLGVNLLPMLPLDGGHALQAALEYAVHPARAETIAARVSAVTAVAAGAAAYHFGLFLATMLCVLFLIQNLALARKQP